MDKTLEEFRLRIAHAQIDSEQIEQDLWDARNRIAVLEAEVARLREACEILIVQVDNRMDAECSCPLCDHDYTHELDCPYERIRDTLRALCTGDPVPETAEAEVTRLRVALAGLLLVTHDSYSPTCGCKICRAVEVGLAALGQKGVGDERH